MSFAAGYEYDLFISYARIDDSAQVVNGRGWVSEFVERLTGHVRGQLGGGARNFRFFFDRGGLQLNEDLERIKAAARRSALFLALTSKSYAESEWCRAEVDAFAGVDSRGERLFALEILPLEEGRKFGSRLDELNRLYFWEVRSTQSEAPRPLFPDTRDFYDHQQKLAAQIVRSLQAIDLKAKAGAGIRVENGPDDTMRRQNGTVFLGQTTEDIDDERVAVRDYLNDLGYLVLPEGDLPGSGEDFKQAVNKSLAGAKLYVQLLSAKAGRRPPDLPEGYLRAQAEAAKAAGVGAMLWRPEKVELAAVADKSHLALLNGEDVMASSLESFKEAVRSRLAKPPQPSQSTGAELSGRDVSYIYFDKNDLPTAKLIQAELTKRRKRSLIPELTAQATRKREFLEKGFTGDNAVILLFGETELDWVLGQLDYYWKLNPETRDDKVVALLVGPPDPKPHDGDELGIGMPELKWIDCRERWDVDALLNLMRQPSAS